MAGQTGRNGHFFLTRDLQQSGFFEAVLPFSNPASATHRVTGSVDEFLEKDGSQGWQAVLTLNIIVHAERETDIQKSILLQKNYTAVEACKIRNPQALAEAMSRAMAKVSQEVMRDIYQALSAATLYRSRLLSFSRREGTPLRHPTFLSPTSRSRFQIRPLLYSTNPASRV